MGTSSNLWASIPRSRPQARLRLFCFSYAGGNASAYYPWIDQLGADVEVGVIHYPGREKRILDPLLYDFTEFLDALTPALAPFLTKSFAFFGHSMGALICFELAHRLRRDYALMPQHLFVSAHHAPQFPDPQPFLHQLSEAGLREELQRLEGTPESILENEELMALLLPVVRSDFSVCKTFQYRQHEPLPCAISAFGGTRDASVSQRELEGWREQTSGSFKLTMFEGGHFFIHTAQARLLAEISHTLLHLSGLESSKKTAIER